MTVPLKPTRVTLAIPLVTLLLGALSWSVASPTQAADVHIEGEIIIDHEGEIIIDHDGDSDSDRKCGIRLFRWLSFGCRSSRGDRHDDDADSDSDKREGYYRRR